MAEYLIQDTTLDAIADAINAKTGGSSAMTPAQMVTAIGSIPTGGGSLGEYTLLGEYEISEPVSAIDFTATAEIRECQTFVFVFDNVTASAGDYLQVNVDGVSMSYINSRSDTYNGEKIHACVSGRNSQLATVFYWAEMMASSAFSIADNYGFFRLRFLQNAKFTSGKLRFYGR